MYCTFKKALKWHMWHAKKNVLRMSVNVHKLNVSWSLYPWLPYISLINSVSIHTFLSMVLVAEKDCPHMSMNKKEVPETINDNDWMINRFTQKAYQLRKQIVIGVLLTAYVIQRDLTFLGVSKAVDHMERCMGHKRLHHQNTESRQQ